MDSKIKSVVRVVTFTKCSTLKSQNSPLQIYIPWVIRHKSIIYLGNSPFIETRFTNRRFLKGSGNETTTLKLLIYVGYTCVRVYVCLCLRGILGLRLLKGEIESDVSRSNTYFMWICFYHLRFLITSKNKSS